MKMMMSFQRKVTGLVFSNGELIQAAEKRRREDSEVIDALKVDHPVREFYMKRCLTKSTPYPAPSGHSDLREKGAGAVLRRV